MCIYAVVSINSHLSQSLLLQVKSLLSHHSVTILKIPVANPSEDLSDGMILKLECCMRCDIFIQVAFSCSVGGKLPFEAIFVSCKDSSRSPTVVILHGGPHSVSVSSYVKSSAFLASLGFNLLIVNYRYGSLKLSRAF